MLVLYRPSVNCLQGCSYLLGYVLSCSKERHDFGVSSITDKRIAILRLTSSYAFIEKPLIPCSGRTFLWHFISDQDHHTTDLCRADAIPL